MATALERQAVLPHGRHDDLLIIGKLLPGMAQREAVLADGGEDQVAVAAERLGSEPVRGPKATKRAMNKLENC